MHFAKSILDGAYEGTLLVASILAAKHKRRIKVFLTSLGGGAFGNPQSWINESIKAALLRFRDQPLDVKLVHYRAPPPGAFDELERCLGPTLVLEPRPVTPQASSSPVSERRRRMGKESG